MKMWGSEKGGLKTIERFVCWGKQAYNALEENLQSLLLVLFPIFVSSSITTSFPILLVIQCLHNEVEMNFWQPCIHQECVLYLGKYNISANGKDGTR